MSGFVKGQCWISEMEPEIGIGYVSHVDERSVGVYFPGCEDVRRYAIKSAPLRRVEFRAGDSVTSKQNLTFTVESVEEFDGLLVYCGEGIELPENELSELMSFNETEMRLKAGFFDEPNAFDLRYRSLVNQYKVRRSPVCGFSGGKIDLIPHQLYIAQETANRYIPRVLLADEVGLGKTIEACLIIHRLFLTGRVRRVLIMVPDSLVNQWFIEFYRKFNLWLSIFDEERCVALESSGAVNPFMDDQLVLCSVNFATGCTKRSSQIVDGEWDLIVVDEAHHLEWSESSASNEYMVVEQLCKKTEGVLLLTATPEQLGIESHFARLRLLDPDRYYDLAAFKKEMNDYAGVAALADALLKESSLSESSVTAIQSIFGVDNEHIAEKIELCKVDMEKGRHALLKELLDQHGTGRVMFRNTRTKLKGFPKRVTHMHTLEANNDALLTSLSDEYDVICRKERETKPFSYKKDPRVDFLVSFLRENPGEKVVLICRSISKVLAIDEALRNQINVKIAVFHENLTLIQRDRNAAWFAEEEGADILLCSEIGSEGRNFQFAHNLVLFDLPFDLELIEQRIGRLDRIGQKTDIHIHIPVVADSPQERFARWAHEGLNLFQTNCSGGNKYIEPFREMLRDIASFSNTSFTTLIDETKSYRKTLHAQLEQGRDHLLELNSFDKEIATELCDSIAEREHNRDLDSFMTDMFDYYGIKVEEMSNRSYYLTPDNLKTDAFPGITQEPKIVTASRSTAISREDWEFLTWDHPMVTGAMELMLGSAEGNCGFAHWPDSASREILLEVVGVLESVAPAKLHIDRFLPSTPIRIVIDNKMALRNKDYTRALIADHAEVADPAKLVDNPAVMKQLIPAMLEKTVGIMEKHRPEIIKKSIAALEDTVGGDIERLVALKKINDNVRTDEIDAAQHQLEQLRHYINDSRLRLDSVCLVWRGPELETVM